MSRTTLLWILWIAMSLPVGAFVVIVIAYGGNRSFLLIGRTTDGHHQIELACDACHTSVFGGPEILQNACMACHGAALARENDSHPKSKFTDPRNADRTAILDARLCVTCHQEHRPGITRAMAVTMPDDYCFHCHRDIGEVTPSHKGLKFDTCASAGCHNFHDNRALYAEFLFEHRKDPAQLRTQVIQIKAFLAAKEERIKKAPRPLVAADADAPEPYRNDEKSVAAWAADVHATAGVNCSGCHTTAAAPTQWVEAPGMDSCKTCHADEATSFVEGKHGMRLRPGLTASRNGPLGLFHEAALGPMTPAEARIPMKAEAAHTALGCNTCHAAHDFDLVRAQVTACAGCHDDAHTRAYFDSPHYTLFKKEIAGELPPGSGVSCATCHMPVLDTRRADGSKAVFVTHNQNDNLRPNEKMFRTACGFCHGLQFSLDALADPALIETNFKGASTKHVESIEWIERKVRERRRRKRK